MATPGQSSTLEQGNPVLFDVAAHIVAFDKGDVDVAIATELLKDLRHLPGGGKAFLNNLSPHDSRKLKMHDVLCKWCNSKPREATSERLIEVLDAKGCEEASKVVRKYLESLGNEGQTQSPNRKRKAETQGREDEAKRTRGAPVVVIPPQAETDSQAASTTELPKHRLEHQQFEHITFDPSWLTTDQKRTVPEHTSFSIENARKPGKEKISVCIITSNNDNEWRQVMKVLTPLPGEETLLAITNRKKDLIFFVGAIAGRKDHEKKYGAVVVKCGQGGEQNERGIGSRRTAMECIEEWDPKVLVTLGVAGATPKHLIEHKVSKDVRIGDVLVAQRLIPYSCHRSGEDEETTVSKAYPYLSFDEMYAVAQFIDMAKHRFEERPNKCREAITDSKSADKLRKKSCVFLGTIMSDDILMDNSKEHKKFVELNQGRSGELPIVGYEMEGHGMAKACKEKNRKDIPVLVIKGVSDFADGYKNKFVPEFPVGEGKEKKSVAQGIAASASVEFFQDLLDDFAPGDNWRDL